MTFTPYDPVKPVRVRLLAPLGFYPRHRIEVPGARLLARDDIVVSAVEIDVRVGDYSGSEDFSELEMLALEEKRFLAAIALAVHPEDGMAHTYPMFYHIQVAPDLDDDALLEAARKYLESGPERQWWWRRPGSALPPDGGGPPYRWRDQGVDADRVLEIVRATNLADQLLMRGLGALLRADMCWARPEIAEAAVMQLYVALEVSFQMVLRLLRDRGMSNPTALDAGAFIDQVFNPGVETGGYFAEYYEDRIKTLHPSSRFGVFAVAPLQADDFYYLRHGMVEVYNWLITKRTLEPSRCATP
jgi:hypothetical protein